MANKHWAQFHRLLRRNRPFPVFRHSLDDRPFRFGAVKYSKNGEWSSSKFLLDWGATDTFVPMSNELKRKVGKVEYFEVTASHAEKKKKSQPKEIKVIQYKVLVNLGVFAGTGDNIIGVDI